ncbi:MAG: glycosyltransferase family 2 protein [Clostridia bacterium]|nr:glycosyltransferase family 2 protein [Clostridia bacterium]
MKIQAIVASLLGTDIFAWGTMSWQEIVIGVCALIGTLITVCSVHAAVFFVVGMFKVKRFPKTDARHTYGICIPARNEDKVIKNLLESIANSDYPLEKLTVFVVADNCTDNTAQVARDFHKDGLKIVVYEHNNPDERTKGFALRYLFDRIEEDYGRKNFDAYFVFDSDNVVARDYFTRMNEAFDEQGQIVVSFRKSKNTNRNWISYGYAMHWIRTCLEEHRGRAVLNQACRVQGTGFMFSNELVKDGWNYTGFTEDRSFCSDAVVQNYRITYCEAAEFYDEQPYSLRVALRQRLRWAKGHLQSTVENCPKLLKNMAKPKKKSFFITWDCFWLNFPRHIEAACRKLITWGMQITLAVIAGSTLGWAQGFLVGLGVGILQKWGLKLLEQIYVFIQYRGVFPKTVWYKRLFHVLMFPFFDIIGKWVMYIALFKKIEWKPIPHDTVVDVNELDKK